MAIKIKKIEEALRQEGYVPEVKEIRKGRKFDKVITSTNTIFFLDKQGWLRDFPSKRLIKKVN